MAPPYDLIYLRVCMKIIYSSWLVLVAWKVIVPENVWIGAIWLPNKYRIRREHISQNLCTCFEIGREFSVKMYNNISVGFNVRMFTASVCVIILTILACIDFWVFFYCTHFWKWNVYMCVSFHVWVAWELYFIFNICRIKIHKTLIDFRIVDEMLIEIVQKCHQAGAEGSLKNISSVKIHIDFEQTDYSVFFCVKHWP